MVNAETFKKIQEDEWEKKRVLQKARDEAEKKFKEEERIRVVQEIIPALKEEIQKELEAIAKEPCDEYGNKRTIRIDYSYYNRDVEHTIYKEVGDYIKSLGFNKYKIVMYYHPGSDAPYDWTTSGVMITFDPWYVY